MNISSIKYLFSKNVSGILITHKNSVLKTKRYILLTINIFETISCDKNEIFIHYDMRLECFGSWLVSCRLFLFCAKKLNQKLNKGKVRVNACLWKSSRCFCTSLIYRNCAKQGKTYGSFSFIVCHSLIFGKIEPEFSKEVLLFTSKK